VAQQQVSPVTTGIVIRPVRRDDYAPWRQLFDGYNTFYGRCGDTRLPEEVVQMTWGRFFDYYEPMHALVAQRDGAIVGLTHFLYHRSTTHISPMCYLQDLFTAQVLRGQGVARSLINAVYDHARAAGASRVYWQTHETNTVAMQLYDKVADKSGFLVYRHLL
jgi:GNAT superfamily N-acetyltransferase